MISPRSFLYCLHNRHLIGDDYDLGAIAGISGKNVEPTIIQSMLERMRHRGPDSMTVKQLEDGAVGCTELSTSDQSTPAFDGKRRPFVLLDGDLYNPRQDGTPDVAFLRQLYKEAGEDCFDQLDGSYACVVVDEDRTILARDPVGARPLIYGEQDGQLHFASEAKALAGHLSQVDELPPGHLYSMDGGLRRMRGPQPEVPEFEDPVQGARVIRDLLTAAVERQMEDGAVGGVALSGGLDSSIIASVAGQLDSNIVMFSSTTARHPSADIEYAKLMAEYLGLEHRITEITDQEIADAIPEAVHYLESFDEDCVSGFIANYFTSKLVREETSCTLVGEGADELFGGYFAELPQLPEDQREELSETLVDIAYNTALRRLDRGWLANSVDYRTPFLDPAVIAFSKKIPGEYKYYQHTNGGRGVEKWILRQAFAEDLPEEIRTRTKMRFSRGVGIDDLMDEATASYATGKELQENPKTATGLALNSPKELHYYRLFRSLFPEGYECLTTRWDPFK